MGAQVSRTDFEWVYTEQPHATRRKEILKKYPEIKLLMGCDPNYKYIVTAVVLVQIMSLWFLKDASLLMLFIAAYFFGGVINCSLAFVIHDVSHNIPFGNSKISHNYWFGMFANLPMGLPVFASFKKYHGDHHRYLTVDYLDVDLPTELEAKMFSTTFTKVLWVLLLPFFYAFRPLFVNPKPVTHWEIKNLIVQLTFDAFVVYFFGLRMLGYLLSATIISMTIHPFAGHFLSEHYMFEDGIETASYYGPLNSIAFNVGYHVEHHDFPSISPFRLPEVKRIAKEFYDDLPYHDSWIKVLWDFITKPAYGPYARIKRKQKSKPE